MSWVCQKPIRGGASPRLQGSRQNVIFSFFRACWRLIVEPQNAARIQTPDNALVQQKLAQIFLNGTSDLQENVTQEITPFLTQVFMVWFILLPV